MTPEASPAVQPAAAPTPVFKRVYVWELPVRIYHWLNALCVLVLTVTGILIAHPPAFASATEASFSYWFGVNRFIHFTTAYVFFFNFAFRIYWGFVGNQFSDWRNFLPLRRAQFRQVGAVLRVDVLQATNKPIDAVGHNSLAYFTYFVMFLVFLFQVISGFAMYASMSKSWFPSSSPGRCRCSAANTGSASGTISPCGSSSSSRSSTSTSCFITIMSRDMGSCRRWSGAGSLCIRTC